MCKKFKHCCWIVCRKHSPMSPNSSCSLARNSAAGSTSTSPSPPKPSSNASILCWYETFCSFAQFQVYLTSFICVCFWEFQRHHSSALHCMQLPFHCPFFTIWRKSCRSDNTLAIDQAWIRVDFFSALNQMNHSAACLLSQTCLSRSTLHSVSGSPLSAEPRQTKSSEK